MPGIIMSPRLRRSLCRSSICTADWQEAKAAGCVYDLVLSTWIHPACFNMELNKRYMDTLREMNFIYWLEEEMITEVPSSSWKRASMARSTPTVDTTISIAHMSWIGSSMQSTKEPKILDSLCRDDAHIHHCLALNGNPEWDDVKALNTSRIYNKDPIADCLVG